MSQVQSQRRFFLVFCFCWLMLAVLGLVWNQPLKAGEVKADRLSVSAPDTVSLGIGNTDSFSVVVDLDSGWHVNTNNPHQDYLIPTRLTLDAQPLSVRSVNYPPGETYSFSFSKEKLDVYSGTTAIDLVLEAPENVGSSLLTGTLKLSYQPCSDRQCLRPQNVTLPLDLRIVAEL